MYKVDRTTNSIVKIEDRTFHEFGLKEREHLQEWIAKCPNCLGEDLLIIQKEFDGFNDTSERLDLLALDKAGTIVVIENKLDDTGKDVTWQALKYVSYCSTLSKPQIKTIYQAYLDKTACSESAEESLVKFFGGVSYDEIMLNEGDQRMILVAGKFRKEVTSTVMWMLGHGIRIQCFKVTPYEFESQVLLDMEQIIPVKEAEEYIIKMADKTREEKVSKEINRDLQELRREFWATLLDKFSTYSPLFQNVSPGADSWLGCGSGISGVPYNFIATKSYAAVELYIGKASPNENEKIFNALHDKKEEIEKAFGSKLSWERLEGKKSSRITKKLNDVDITDKEDWPKIVEFLCDAMVKLAGALREYLPVAAKS